MSDFSVWLQSRHIAVPTCAPKWSMSAISGLRQRLNLLQGISGISATQRLLLPFLPGPAHPQSVLCLYRDIGAGHPSLTEKKENKDEIQVRSHPETRVSVWAPSAAEVGLFLELQRILLDTWWIYITGIPLMSALKRDFSCSQETL